MDIDDRVRYPTIEGTNWFARMSPDFPDFWGVLVEKGWAKAFSNYKALGKGGFSA